MHQHPRPPPATASPANSEQTNPTRTNNPRDRDVEALRTASPMTQGSGSSEDFGPARQEQPIERLNQVIRNFHTKAALIILHSRVELSPAFSRGTDVVRVNKWFNIELDETEDYKDEIKTWKTCDLKDDRPPPLIIEIYLNTDTLNQGQRLVLLDDQGKRWDVKNALSSSSGTRTGKNRALTDNEVVLERWVIELGEQTAPLPADMASLLPLVYKKSIVLFRSLFTYCNFLPTFKLSKKVGRSRSGASVRLNYRILDGTQTKEHASSTDSLVAPLCESAGRVVSEYSFGVTESPAGPFSVSVTYRQNCEFRVDDSEELLSQQFLGSEDDLFRPSLPREDAQERPRVSAAQEVGSLPIDHRRNLMERPELGHAYGSLSTFHQAGISTGTSPISALRNAQELGADSPSPTEPGRGFPSQPSNQSSRSSLRPSATGTGRRSSFSFQPFKAPVLSASPLAASPLASSPRPSINRVSALSPLTEERTSHGPPTPGHVARKSVSLAPEHAIASSASSSPKPAPITRYSSSFSHRRARVSSGGTNKTEEDQNSSGRASATSSAQPGSGLIAEAAGGDGSSGSMQADDENITDFLKMLDMKKDLLTPSDAASAEASTRRTAAALTRFHRMRDSNAALSDSMSSSLMMHRSSSSSSRQLSSVPPMVAATSVSTSSSPGKPISPHTPHTPFAPSRLSAAYSHDDVHPQHRPPREVEPPSPSEPTSDDTNQTRSTVNVPAIDIPSSPRPFLSNFRRSSSAQRGPLPGDDEVGGLYGMSLDAQERRSVRATTTRTDGTGDAPEATNQGNGQAPTRHPGPNASPRHSSSLRGALGQSNQPGDGTASGDGSGHSSTQVYRSRYARGGAGRGVTPPQGSTSSFGGTGGSLERDRDSGSGSGSWGRGGRRSGSKPDNRFDDDEFLFTMEKSDFTSAAGGESSSKR